MRERNSIAVPITMLWMVFVTNPTTNPVMPAMIRTTMIIVHIALLLIMIMFLVREKFC